MVQSARGGRAHRDGARRLAADEKATIELFEKSRASVVYITTAQLVRDVWTRNVFSVPRGTGSGFIWDDAGHVVTNFHVIRARPKPPSSLPTAATTRPRWWGRAQRTTSPYSRSVSASNARLPCRSAPAPTSRWDRRCLLSATFWPGLDAHHRHRLRARPLVTGRSGRPSTLITWFRPTPPLTPATRAAPARFGRAAYRHQHGDLQPLRRLGRDRFCRAGGHRHAGSAATHQDRQIHPPGAWHRVDEQAQSAPACADGKQGRVRAACHPGSAAHKAGLAGVEVTPQGIVPGDRIIDVDGKATDDVAKLLARLDDRKVGDVVVLSVERAGKSREVRVELQPGID